jgi:RNA polymerase sigma-70 factor (ECF subfamily)
MIAQEDKALIECARQRDGKAFTALCMPCVTRLRFFLMSRGANPDDCEDLIQETFLHAWRSIEHFRGEAAFFTWLAKITYNVLVGDYRRRKCRVQAISLDTPQREDGRAFSDLPDPEVDIHADAENRDLVALISWRVHPKKFRILWMRFAEGMSVEEVVWATGRTRSVVKNATTRAKMEARRVLEQKGNVQMWTC